MSTLSQFKLLRKRSSHLEFDQTKVVKIYKNQDLPQSGTPFTDPLFPPNANSILGKDQNGNYIDKVDGPKRESLFKMDEIEWKRASDIFPQQQLFEGKISVDDVKQGKIGNCYFLSAIAAMCEFPNLITQIFISKEISKDGFYKVILFIDGEYQIVFLDDYFPVLKGTNIFYFAKPNSFELWAILLEKAWAKINGGYSNIISGWPNDVFRAFTGFACEELIHRENKNDRLWGIISTVDNNYGVICASTKSDDLVVKKGLVKNHAYTLIDTEEIEDDQGKKVRLVQLRNPWGYKEWNGDWSDESPLWTEKTKKQIPNWGAKNNGSFWMTIEDFNKYFLRTDLCQVVYAAKLKYLDFTGEDAKKPQVLNIYLEKKGILSISVIEKNWRYNRELRDVEHPTSLMIAEYEPNLKIIKHAFTDFSTNSDTEKTRILNPGYYIVWLYKAYDISQEPKPDWFRVKIACDANYSVKKIGADEDCLILQEIIAQGIRHHNKDKMKPNEIFYDIRNSFNKSGIAYRIAINPMSTCFQKWENNATKVENIELLPPFKGQTNFNFGVPPNGYAMVLGIQKCMYGTHWFNIESKVETYECREGEDPIKAVRKEFDTFCTNDVNTLEQKYDFITSSFEILSASVSFPTIDRNKIWIEKLSKKYPLIMKAILELKPIEDVSNVNWVVIKRPIGLYVGQANFTTREGRGGFHFNEDGTTWIGYWENNDKGKYGKLYGKDGKLIYEGEYENGRRNGKGTYYFSSGEKYEGEFRDGKREGKGTFYWDDTSRWEGTFVDNEMDGEGTFYDGEDSWSAKYEKGQLVEE